MIRPSNQSCYLYFKECTKDFGAYNVIENYGNMITRKKFLKDVDAIAGYLDKNNIKRGDVVTIFLPNIPQCFAAFYAVNKIGAIANIVHALMTPNILEEILETTKSKAIFVYDMIMEPCKNVLDKFDGITIVCSTSDYVSTVAKPVFKVFEKVKVKAEINNQRKISYINLCLISSQFLGCQLVHH